jgi:hypothetical protein
VAFGYITELHPMGVDAFNTSLEESHLGLSTAWVTAGGVADSLFSCHDRDPNMQVSQSEESKYFFISPNGFYVAPSKT